MPRRKPRLTFASGAPIPRRSSCSSSTAHSVALLWDYERFQAWVAGMLGKDRGRGVVLVDLAVGAVGLAIVLLAWFVY